MKEKIFVLSYFYLLFFDICNHCFVVHYIVLAMGMPANICKLYLHKCFGFETKFMLLC